MKGWCEVYRQMLDGPHMPSSGSSSHDPFSVGELKDRKQHLLTTANEHSHQDWFQMPMRFWRRSICEVYRQQTPRTTQVMTIPHMTICVTLINKRPKKIIYHYWNFNMENYQNVPIIIIKTKVLLPQAYVTSADFAYPV